MIYALCPIIDIIDIRPMPYRIDMYSTVSICPIVDIPPTVPKNVFANFISSRAGNKAEMK